MNRILLSVLVAIVSTSLSRSSAQRPVIPDLPEPITLGRPLLPGGSSIRIPRPTLPSSLGSGIRLRMPSSPFSRPGSRLPSSQSQDPGDPPSDSGGMMLPSGPITYANGETLLVRKEDGTTEVARYHVGVGSTRVVLMPDGRLEPFDGSRTQATDEPFEPLGISDMEAKMLDDPRLEGFKAIRSRRFLYVYNTSETFIRTTRTILETMYPAIRKYFSRSSIDVHEPEFPLVIVAFATENEYQEFRRMPRGVVAYYDTLSNHVALYERSSLSSNVPEIAIKNAISTIAHEGAHQVLHNIGVQQRMSRWPLWLSEGIAEFFAPTSVDRGAKWQGLGATNELRMHEIDSDWKQRRPSGNGQNLHKIVAATELSSLEYAYSWGLIHMLSKRRQKELFACVRKCSEFRPMDGLPSSGPEVAEQSVPSPEQVFTTHFGDDFSGLEREMIRHLTSLNYVDPVANQTHYIVIAAGRVYMTTSPKRVQEIRKQMIIGNIQVRTFPNRRAAERAMKTLTQ